MKVSDETSQTDLDSCTASTGYVVSRLVKQVQPVLVSLQTNYLVAKVTVVPKMYSVVTQTSHSVTAGWKLTVQVEGHFVSLSLSLSL